MRSPFRRRGETPRKPRGARAAEIESLRVALVDERAAISGEDERRELEAAGALQRNPRPISATEEHELGVAGVTTIEDEAAKDRRVERLRAIDRALATIDQKDFGICSRCGRRIEIARLHAHPDTTLCESCVRVALPPAEPAGQPSPVDSDVDEPPSRSL